MRIGFWLTSTTRNLTKETWGKLPLGGAEISAVNLGEELIKLGHEVTYYAQRCISFEKDKLRVRIHGSVFSDELDYFICVRPHPIIGRVKFNKNILWSGDAHDQPSNRMFEHEELARKVDAFVFKTLWQKDTILDRFFFIDSEKTHVIYNGYNQKHYRNLKAEPQKNRFIHASTWFRGAYNFVELWPMIRKKLPDAELHVYSKTKLYSDTNQQDGWKEIYQRLSRMKGIYLHDPVTQREIVKELRKSWLMLYPNTHFVESSCGIALQSIAAGTPVVTMNRAGLKETVGLDGILIESSPDWKEKFVEGACCQSILRNQLSLSGLLRVKNQYTWKNRAKRWEDFLKSL